MNRFDLKTRNEISILIGFLSALDEEVVSDEDYLLIKKKNANDEEDLNFIYNLILKPWFLEYTPTNRDKVVNAINYFIGKQKHLLDSVFFEVNFIFDYEIKDKLLFLTRVKTLLDDYAEREN